MSKPQFKYLYKRESCQQSQFEISDIPLENLNPIIAFSKAARLGKPYVMIEGNYQAGIFHNNLLLIDSRLPEILSALNFLCKGRLLLLKVACNILNANNPINYNQVFTYNFYTHKLKQLLSEVLFGMSPSKVWNGSYETQGMHIKIKTYNETEYYAVYNRLLLEDYLLLNTSIKYDGAHLRIFHN